MPAASRLTALVACLALGALGLPGQASAAGPVAPSSGDPVLPHASHGGAAVTALGDRLSSVAARNGLSSTRLREILRTDRTAWLTPEGRMYYVEDAPTTAEATTSASGSTAYAPVFPTSQTFALHSRPGATRTIYLDVDGGTVSGSAWNSATFPNGSHIGFDLDGSPSTFSTAEHGFVQEVWREVAETYAPFDVDVTTQDAGTDAYARTSSSDPTYGTKVMITSDKVAQQQLCGSCLGVAWIGTFDNVDSTARYQPAWVFAYSTTFDPMVIAQGVSHETGHTLGLHHDGTPTASYYGGTSTWGPIMGSARTRAISQWSRGEYAGASNTEDDLAIIAANGLPLRPDDHGSTTGTADQLGATSSYDAHGVVETRGDADVFAVSLPCTTDLTVTATGIGAQTALDLSVQVLDTGGYVVASGSPASGSTGNPPVSTGMDATATVTGASGTYYLRVDGVGNGDPSGTGWSDYGSLGQYHLTATGCAQEPTPPPSDPPPTTPSTTPPPPPPTTTSTPPPTTVSGSTSSATRPTAPRIGTASSGTRGGAVTAVARWSAPTRTGGAAISGYRLRALRLDSHGRVVRTYLTGWVRPSARIVTLRLPRGRYAFKVAAWNRVGGSAWSTSSRRVTAR